MKNIRRTVLLVLMVGIAFVTGCSSTEDDPRDALIGTWTAEYDDDGCTIATDIVFSDGGAFTLDQDDECDDYTMAGQGTWDIVGGAIKIRFTDVDGVDPDYVPDEGVDIPLYYFFTVSGQLGISWDDDIFERDGSGTTLVDTWVQEDSDCMTTVDIYNTGDIEYEKACGEEIVDSFTGHYVQSGNKLTVNTGVGTRYFHYQFLSTDYLALIPSQQLFTRE